MCKSVNKKEKKRKKKSKGYLTLVRVFGRFHHKQTSKTYNDFLKESYSNAMNNNIPYLGDYPDD